MGIMGRRRTHKAPGGPSGVQGKGTLMEQVRRKFPGGRIRPAPPGMAAGDGGGCILVEHESGNTYLCCLNEAEEVVCRMATIKAAGDDDSSGTGPGRAKIPNYIRGTKRRRRAARGRIRG